VRAPRHARAAISATAAADLKCSISTIPTTERTSVVRRILEARHRKAGRPAARHIDLERMHQLVSGSGTGGHGQMKGGKVKSARPTARKRSSGAHRQDARRRAKTRTVFPIVVSVPRQAGSTPSRNSSVPCPPTAAAAFVLIQHLDPTRESLTADLVGTYTRMRVSRWRTACRWRRTGST